MKHWVQTAAAAAAAVILAVSAPFQVSAAATNWAKKVRDDDRQQLILLDQKDPLDYVYLITPDPVKRQILIVTAQGITRGCKSDEEKALRIYEWVTENVYYDWDGVNSGELSGADPYSVLTNHYSVCEGYATLFAELLNSVGVPCVTFHGASTSGLWTEEEYNDIDHAWNAVWLDGEWVYCDPTWDSGNSRHQGNFQLGVSGTDYYALNAQRFAVGHRSAYRINDNGGFRYAGGNWLRYDEEGNLLTGLVPDYYDRCLYGYRRGVPVSGRTIYDYQLAEFSDAGKYLETCYDFTGWFKENGSWYYVLEGFACYGWGQIGGKWYYLDPDNCIMKTGWQKVDGKWYYLTGSGAMATGWQKVNEKWYYLSGSGAMATGWRQVNGKWYYLNSDGAMAIGWKKVGNKWYYLSPSGAMAIGWWKVNGNWYYLNGDGSMAANTTVDGIRLNGQGAAAREPDV